MPTAENAALYYEHSQTLVPMKELMNAGDNINFKSTDQLWSKRSQREPNVKPNGLATGGRVLPATGNDVIQVADLTCYLMGVLTPVSASLSEAVTRAPTLTHQISSVVITSAGAISIVAGTEGSSFTESRGSAGGPPYIDVDGFELAQVRLSSGDSGQIIDTEILQVPNVHTEWYNNPIWEERRVVVENGIIGLAGVEFQASLPLIHTGDLPKQVFAEYYVPEFSLVPIASDFVPPEQAYSTTSTQAYRKTIAATSKTLNQGTFTAYLEDGISDNILYSVGETLWFKFKSDILAGPYILCQGIMGAPRSFPPADNIIASCTINALNSEDSVNVIA